MNNPYFPHRKIRHAKLLTQAGFKIDKRWYKLSETPPKETNCSKLIYWTNGKINLAFFDYELVSPKTLVERIARCVQHTTRQLAKITWGKESEL